MLSRNIDQLNVEIKRKMDEYLDIAREMGKTTDSTNRDAEADLLLHDISDTQRKKDDLTTQLYQTQTDFMIMKGELEDPSLIEANFDDLIDKDPTVMMTKQQIGMMQMSQSSQTNSGNKGNACVNQQNNRQVEALNKSLEAYKAEQKKKYLHDFNSKPNVALQQLMKHYRTMFGSQQSQLAAVQKQLDSKMADLKKRIERSTELETREEDLKQLQAIAKDMSIKLESLDIDANAPDQIRQVQPAVATNNINTLQHYSIAVLGAMLGFSLTCLGVAYLEFRTRRLNGPDEMDEGLGIRVVGILPGLSSKKALDPTHPVVAQLTESIDGVRTILMHDSSSKRRQVVLVTSATTLEGRTTVSSQLAASLARAGRRTLLIDGDFAARPCRRSSTCRWKTACAKCFAPRSTWPT